MIDENIHLKWMTLAINEAERAIDKGEVPVGCVIVNDGKMIAKSHNLVETLNDATAHSEMMAITSASENLCSKVLEGCSMYVTLEPCVMCGGALYWSQISKVVYGASDEKRGFKAKIGELHPKTEIVSGIMEEECGQLMKEFFQRKR